MGKSRLSQYGGGQLWRKPLPVITILDMKSESNANRAAGTAALLSILAFTGMVAVNGLASALPLNGVNTGQLSDELPNLFVPAGIIFSIWGLIYLLLAGYVAAAAREAFRSVSGGRRAWTGRDGVLFIMNAAANSAWILAWHWRLVGTSLVIMLVILGTLVALERDSERKLGSGGILEKGTGKEPGSIRLRRFLLIVPLRVYLGWICVATIANVTALLVKTRWDGFGLDPRIWTVAVILAGLTVALGFSIWKRQIAAPLVVVWAYAGIVLKRVSTDPDYSAPVWIAAGLAALVILASLVRVRIACPLFGRGQTSGTNHGAHGGHGGNEGIT